MGRSRFDAALDRFKSEERPEAVLLVASHKDYAHIAAAWMHSDVHRATRLSKFEADSDSNTWIWLWKNARFSQEELARASGVPLPRCEEKLNTLIANRAIYPDGTVNSFVRRYLREKVLKLLGLDAKARRELKRAGDRPAL